MKKILITGSAGFIGFHVFRKLVALGYDVLGVDNLNNYYDVNLKLARLKECGFEAENIAYGRMLQSEHSGRFCQMSLEDSAAIIKLFHREKFDCVCHLAAQAGVRYSVENPSAYIQSNINGFFNILESCRENMVEHLVYASSSSVYGNESQVPFREDEKLSAPASLYAATKQSNESMAECYGKLYSMRSTGLRFFTVYGPWGRPDMALFKFTKAILHGKPIQVYNHGDMQRDFTYVDDIVEGVVRVLCGRKECKESACCTVYNIGNGHPVGLLDFIHEIEKQTGKKAVLELLPLQAGDVYQTWADTAKLEKDYHFSPKVPIAEGVKAFVEWYKKFYLPE